MLPGEARGGEGNAPEWDRVHSYRPRGCSPRGGEHASDGHRGWTGRCQSSCRSGAAAPAGPNEREQEPGPRPRLKPAPRGARVPSKTPRIVRNGRHTTLLFPQPVLMYPRSELLRIDTQDPPPFQHSLAPPPHASASRQPLVRIAYAAPRSFPFQPRAPLPTTCSSWAAAPPVSR
jgi:hypothetical protein